MKKIFVFLLLMVVSFALKAQYPITQNLGSNNTLIRLGSTYGGALKGNLIQGVYADTTEANSGYIDLYPGAIIFSTGNSTMYVRNAAADGWIALATGLSAINIYTSDGTLTGNRTLAGVGNSLTFSGLSDFLVEDATGEIRLGTSEFNRLRISSGFTAFISLDADSLLMTRLPQSQLLSTDSVLVRTADFKVKTRAVSSIGSTYTAGNGLTLSGSQFKLGGTLTEPTIITGSETNLLKLDGYTSANVGYLGIGTDFGYIRFGDGGAFSPTYENEIYGGVSQIGLKTTGDIYLDAGDIYTIGIPTVSSTTGRKVALIDTATGKVERIDPASFATTSLPISSLTAATGANTIDNGNYTQTWRWNTLNSSAISLISTSTQSTSANHKMLTINTDGVNATSNAYTFGIDITNSHSGTNSTNHGINMNVYGANDNNGYTASIFSGTNSNTGFSSAITSTGATNSYGFKSTIGGSGTNSYGGYFTATAAGTNSYGGYFSVAGTATNNYASYFSATNATNNYALVVPSGGGRVGLGTATPNASALLDVTSTTQGAVLPRMNTTQMNAISSPVAGLMVYNSDSTSYCYYNGSAWLKMGSGAGGSYTAGNGLTLSGSQFELGGALSKPTSITGNYKLFLNNRHTHIQGDTVYFASNTNNLINLNSSGGLGDELLLEANGGAIRFTSVSDLYMPAPIFTGTVSSGASTDSILTVNTLTGEVRKRHWPQQKISLVFGAGSGADSDTTAFTTSAIYGSFYNDADTIVVTSMRSVLQGTSPDVTYKVWYNDSLNVEAGATALVTAGSQVTNTTTGTNVTSFDVTKIPPGVWVWVKTSTVATKPKYFSLTINGYRK